MNRDDNSPYLLFIEPPKKEKLTSPVEDELTELVEMALGKAKEGTAAYNDLEDTEGIFDEDSSYRGFHITQCGEVSSNVDYLLENGMITNSLAPYYLKWYRNSIPESDIQKLMALKKFYE